MSIEVITLYLAAGLVAGLLAGLFGIGGGLTTVPILYLSLPQLGISQGLVMHLAIGTSLAVMIVTASESSYSHHRKGDVPWAEVGKLIPAVAVGALLAALAARWIATDVLRYFFIALVAFTIFRALTKKGFTADYEAKDFIPPSKRVCLAVGLGIGVVSALLGIGGSPMTVPFMRRAKLRMANAVAIASAVGLPVAVVGAIGYVITGWDTPGLPAGATGYVYWPAAPGLLAGILVAVPFGTRLSHRLADKLNARLFVGFLFVVLATMTAG